MHPYRTTSSKKTQVGRVMEVLPVWVGIVVDASAAAHLDEHSFHAAVNHAPAASQQQEYFKRSALKYWFPLQSTLLKYWFPLQNSALKYWFPTAKK
jgi:hypothetical protein